MSEVKNNSLKLPSGGASICFNCERAVGYCSWSKWLIPVEGWTAVPSKLGENRIRVIECPLFIESPSRKRTNGELDKYESDKFLKDPDKYISERDRGNLIKRRRRGN